MATYPKQYEKNGKTKTASNRRQEVELRFAGYREVVESVESAPAPSLAEATKPEAVAESNEAEVPSEQTKTKQKSLPQRQN
jgi:hypothetical protein